MKKKYKLISDKNIEIRKKMKFFIILNDEIFWLKLQKLENALHRIYRYREYRTKFLIPWKKIMNSFIENYKLIENDKRESTEILFELLSSKEICEQKD